MTDMTQRSCIHQFHVHKLHWNNAYCTEQKWLMGQPDWLIGNLYVCTTYTRLISVMSCQICPRLRYTSFGFMSSIEMIINVLNISGWRGNLGGWWGFLYVCTPSTKLISVMSCQTCPRGLAHINSTFISSFEMIITILNTSGCNGNHICDITWLIITLYRE